MAEAGKWSASMSALTASAMAPGGASQRPALPRSSSSAADSPSAAPANPFLLSFSLRAVNAGHLHPHAKRFAVQMLCTDNR